MPKTFSVSILKTFALVTILFLSLTSESFGQSIQTNTPINCKADSDGFFSYGHLEKCSVTMAQCLRLPGVPTQDTSTSPNTVTCAVTSTGGSDGNTGNTGSGVGNTGNTGNTGSGVGDTGDTGNTGSGVGDVNPPPTVVKLLNPLKVDKLEDLFSSILTIVIILAIPLIVFFIIYSGFLYVTARGNPAQIEQATKSLTYAIIGGVLIVGAVAITEIIKSLVNSLLA